MRYCGDCDEVLVPEEFSDHEDHGYFEDRHAAAALVIKDRGGLDRAALIVGRDMAEQIKRALEPKVNLRLKATWRMIYDRARDRSRESGSV